MYSWETKPTSLKPSKSGYFQSISMWNENKIETKEKEKSGWIGVEKLAGRRQDKNGALKKGQDEDMHTIFSFVTCA